MSSSDTYDIIFKDVTWKYSGSEKAAIRNINLRLKKGEIVVITGPSGAGKTTLCRCINGLIPHFFRGELQGDITVAGLNLRKYDIPIMASKVGLCFDNPSHQLFCSTVVEEIAFGPENYCVPVKEIRARVQHALEFCRLEGYEDKSPYSLSGGEQQSCAIAAISAMEPEVLVLDEPTSNLDPYGTELVIDRINNLVRSKRRTMIIVEHKLEHVLPFADRMVVMSEGEIVAEGPPTEVLREIDLISGLQLQVPHATQLAYRLGRGSIPITQQDGVKFLSEYLTQRELNKGLIQSRMNELKSREKRSEFLSSQNIAVSCQDVWYQYPDGTVALKGASLNIYPGEFVGFIGRNGSGKTTLAKLVNGLYNPSRGKVYVYGIDTSTQEVGALSKIVGYSFQNPDDQIFSRTVREEFEFGPKNLKLPMEEIEKRVELVAKDLEIYDFLDQNPFSLSQGLRQRVAFGSVLTMDPKILIVDEPTTGQDYMRAKTIMEIAKRQNQKGITIIIISHNMDLIAEYCTRIFALKEGQIFLSGTPREVFSKPDLLIQTSIKPPQVTRIFQNLAELPPDVLTLAEALELLK